MLPGRQTIHPSHASRVRSQEVTSTGDACATLGNHYARAALYAGLGGALGQMLYGLTPVLLARYLGPRDYGVYALLMSLAAMVVSVFSLGQNAALHKLLPEFMVKAPARAGNILADVLLLTAVALAVSCAAFFGLSERLAIHVYHDASLTGLFRLCALSAFTLALFNLAASVVAGLQDFKTYQRNTVVRNLALLALAWLGVRGFGLQGALAGQS
jgi:O-antigen/teichoic acid export membrane protein